MKNVALLLLISTILSAQTIPEWRTWAVKPPMGWNSFDAYDCRITEQDFKAVVDIMAEEYQPYGWEYAVIDYVWYHPNPGNWDTPRRFGHPNIRLDDKGRPLDYIALDAYGRTIPAINRFPSSEEGKGFKPLADYVHSRGLKFGIHIMRGIHRQAYFENTPILGSIYRARDIADTTSLCGFCNHMFGVNPAKPGAQAYYNSLFQQYAEWGVDFVKVDGIAKPYYAGEIELIRNAIDQCGRPIILSVSCGPTQLENADHVKNHTNMWRISSDFWDQWKKLHQSFELQSDWTPYRSNGQWPDADMIPFGKLSLDNRPHGKERLSKFTEAEHRTLMTLWCIARSPLMIGADLISSPPASLEWFKNKEVIDVNQNSEKNHELFRRNGFIAWIADVPESTDKYLAIFNVENENTETIIVSTRELGLKGTCTVKDLWNKTVTEKSTKQIKATIEAHDAVLYKILPK